MIDSWRKPSCYNEPREGSLAESQVARGQFRESTRPGGRLQSRPPTRPLTRRRHGYTPGRLPSPRRPMTTPINGRRGWNMTFERVPSGALFFVCGWSLWLRKWLRVVVRRPLATPLLNPRSSHSLLVFPRINQFTDLGWWSRGDSNRNALTSGCRHCPRSSATSSVLAEPPTRRWRTPYNHAF
jgi:hypothetical protein